MNDIPKFQVGQEVFHRSCNAKGTVIAVIDFGDCYRYLVAFAVGQGNHACTPFELSAEMSYVAEK